MSLTNLGGSLTPKVHDGSAVDRVYGVDADGLFIGVVPSADAAAAATIPPPQRGLWRWDGSAWVAFKSRSQLAAEIETERDVRLDVGVAWGGRTWYSDATFQQQLAAYLQLYGAGIVPADATLPVRAMDKVVYQLGLDEMKALAGALMLQVQAVWAWSWEQKAAVGA